MKKAEIEKINRLRSLFPAEINVSVKRSKIGKYCAEITTFPNCFTEADSFSDLIEMVNDAVRTYFEIPKKYLSFMPSYMSLIAQN